MNMRTPSAQQSTFSVYPGRDGSRISGALYAHVPHSVVIGRPGTNSLDSPKSVS